MSRDGPRNVAAAALAAGVAWRLVPLAVARAPSRLQRVNVSGATVPAVLGAPLVAGALSGIGTAWACGAPGSSGEERRALATSAGVLVVLGVAGAVDDLRGDEPARGFAGHLRALGRGRVTGGTVKIAAGCLAGLGAGAALERGPAGLETAALVALTANWINLVDRAPGRAAKASAAGGLPLCIAGSAEFRPAAWALLGALAGCAPADLGERAMLGDSGANALGALLGLGLAVSLSHRARRTVIAALVALTTASERWSYSRIIEDAAPLRWVDRLGRNREIRSGRASVE
jgi:UDP-GlcNAc:undecaprenyl-phosphate GlcNAc-1-phosphate transferase